MDADNLNQLPKKHATNTFSSSPVFRKLVQEYAREVGMSFSEAVRYLLITGMKVQTDFGVRDRLAHLTELDREVKRQYRQDNVEEYLRSDRERPKNRFEIQNERLEELERKLERVTGEAISEKQLKQKQEDEANREKMGLDYFNTDMSIYVGQKRRN